MLSVRHQIQRWVVRQLQGLVDFLQPPWPTLSDGSPFPKDGFLWSARGDLDDGDDSALRIHNLEGTFGSPCPGQLESQESAARSPHQRHATMTKSNRKGVREDVPLHLMPKLKLAVHVFVVTLGVLLWFMPILIWIVSSPVPWFAFDDGYGNAQSSLQWHSGYNMDGLRTTAATTTAVKESPDVVSKPEPVNDDRPRAAMISLVRNSDLDLVLRSMRQLETRWNARYRYPWVFFSDEPLSREFKVHSLQG